MNKKWVDEFTRDLIAFGSIPFLVITITRVSVMTIYYPMQFIVSSILFFILKYIFKANLRAGIGLILLTFTSIYYNHLLFTIFALIVYIGLIAALFYLKRNKKDVLKGILLGVLSAIIAYFIVRLAFP